MLKGHFMKLIIPLFFCLFLFSNPTNAAEWIVNRDHSEIFFSVPYLNVSEVTGRFADFKGAVEIDEESGKIQQLELFILPDSLNTENRLRDGHLKAPDFLNVKRFPEISFVSTSVTPLAGQSFMTKGMLILKGNRHPLTVNFKLSSNQKDSWGYENRFASFEFTLNRKELGLTWNKTLADNKYLVGDVIKVRGNLQFQPLNSLTPGSKHYIPVTSFTRGKERLKRGEITQEKFAEVYGPSRDVPVVAIKIGESKGDPQPRQVFAARQDLDFRNSFNWWIAFSTLGLLGFFAAIILGLFAKNKVLDLFPQRYKEQGLLGSLSDLMVVGFTFVYSMALWYVGWGH